MCSCRHVSAPPHRAAPAPLTPASPLSAPNPPQAAYATGVGTMVPRSRDAGGSSQDFERLLPATPLFNPLLGNISTPIILISQPRSTASFVLADVRGSPAHRDVQDRVIATGRPDMTGFATDLKASAAGRRRERPLAPRPCPCPYRGVLRCKTLSRHWLCRSACSRAPGGLGLHPHASCLPPLQHTHTGQLARRAHDDLQPRAQQVHLGGH